MRGRGIRNLLIVIVVLGGLLTAADRLAAAYAQSQAADRIRSSDGMAATPSVSIKGFPFLTQVAAHRLTEVTVTATAISGSSTTGGLPISRFTADLHDVRLNGDFSRAVASTATGTALITYADLGKQAPNGITVGYGGTDSGGRGLLKFTGSYQVPLLGTQQFSVTGHVAVKGGRTLRVVADGKPVVLGMRLPVSVDALIRQQTDFSGALPALPSGIALGGVTATPDGVEVALTGTDVPLTG